MRALGNFCGLAVFDSLYATGRDPDTGKIHRVDGQDAPELEDVKRVLLDRGEGLGHKWVPVSLAEPVL